MAESMAVEDDTSNPTDEIVYVYPLPKGLETNCPVCFVALYRDPFVNMECGHHLCGSCIKRLKDCPECRRLLKVIPDRGLQRVLKSLQVYCSKREEGCNWEGELGELQHHHNNDCMHLMIQCITCNCKGPRHLILIHEKEECPNRMVLCEHCNYQCIWRELADSHYSQCLQYPLTCSNCNANITRQDEMTHLKEFCPKTTVVCEAYQYGCKWEGLREEREKHLKDDWVGHFSLCLKEGCTLSVSSAKEIIAECKDEIRQLRAEINEKNEEIALLRQKVSTLEDSIGKHSNDSTMTQHILSLKSELKQEITTRLEMMKGELRQEFSDYIDDSKEEETEEEEEEEEVEYEYDYGLSQASHSLLSDTVKQKPTFTYELKRFYKHKNKDTSCFSPSFYANCYNMRLRVHPNGYGKGKGSFVSVYACLVEGDYDDIVLWPFQGKVIVELEHNSNGQPLKRFVKYGFDIPEEFSTVAGRNHSSKGNGWPKFLSHSELSNYLIFNSTLIFHVYVYSL